MNKIRKSYVFSWILDQEDDKFFGKLGKNIRLVNLDSKEVRDFEYNFVF